MDNKEAILRIKDHMEVHGIGTGYHIKIAEALSVAIKALENQPLHIDREKWTAEWIYPENEYSLPRCSKCGCNSKDATYGNKDNFCPKCGRAMNNKAWAELRKRLEGMMDA